MVDGPSFGLGFIAIPAILLVARVLKRGLQRVSFRPDSKPHASGMKASGAGRGGRGWPGGEPPLNATRRGRPYDTQPASQSFIPRARLPQVVITGATRGLGLALAKQFLSLGDDVVICGRDGARVEASVQLLKEAYPGAVVAGVQCDVSKPEDVERLGREALAALGGGIDIWICNAAQSAGSRALLTQTSPEEIQAIVGTNLTGSILCAREAMKLMSLPACSPGKVARGGGVFFLGGVFAREVSGGLA